MFPFIWADYSTPSNTALETQRALEFSRPPKFTHALILAFLRGGGMEYKFSKMVLST